MVLPNEIKMINHNGTIFFADVCRRNNPVTWENEYLYNRDTDAFQYRVRVPGVVVSMIIQDVTKAELRQFIRDGKPIRIKAAVSSVVYAS